MNTYDQYNQYIKDKTTTDLDVVSTGYGNIDQFLAYGGMQPDFCFVILGKSGTGKTYFTINLSINTALKGKKCLFLSLEMSFNAIMDRFLQVILGVHLSELKKYIQENEKEVTNTLVDMGFFDNIIIYDGVYNLKEISEIIVSEKPDVIYVDHLHLIRTKYTNIFEHTTHCMKGIHYMKKQFKTRFVVLVQVARDKDEKFSGSKPAYIESGKGSGAIEEYADYVIGLGRPDIDPSAEGSKLNIIEAIPRKCRFPSQQMWQAIQWRYDRRTGKLIEKIY